MTERYPHKQTTQEGHTHEVCPRCGAELCAGLILEAGTQKAIRSATSSSRPSSENPEGYARAYGWPEVCCFCSVIGIEIRGRYDGVCEWLYPCCGLRVDRWTREEVAEQPENDHES
jgi:hypothetical protein